MSEKTKEVMGFLNGMTAALFGRGLEDCMLNGICVTCHGPIEDYDFRDELSRKEYGISGMCQTCQDKTFSNLED